MRHQLERVTDFMLRMLLKKWVEPDKTLCRETVVFIKIDKDWYITRSTLIDRFAVLMSDPQTLPELAPYLLTKHHILKKHALKTNPEIGLPLIAVLQDTLDLFGVRKQTEGSVGRGYVRVTFWAGRNLLGAVIIIPDHDKERRT